MQTLNIGHNARVNICKVMAILPWRSAPVKAIKKTAKENDRFIDASYGKPTRSLIIMSEGLVIGTSVMTDTLNDRLSENRQPHSHACRQNHDH